MTETHSRTHLLRTPWLLAAAALMVGLGSPGCDGADAEPEGLRARLFGPGGTDNPFNGVSWLRMYVRGDGMASPLGRFVRYQPGGSADLTGIPFGDPGQRRQLVVEGWAADEGGDPAYILSTGRSPWFEVRPTGEPLDLEVLFSRVNSVVELPSATSGIAQRIQSGRMGAAVATTEQEIVITGGGAVDSVSAAWWRGNEFSSVIASVETIDVRTHNVATRANLMFPRVWHSATGLQYGQVIIAGGFGGDGQPMAEVELYNPPNVSNGQPARLPALAVPRAGHTATLIDPQERLLLFVGGDATGTWELWDPAAGSRGAIPLPDAKQRRHHRATVFDIPNRVEPGVFISGGESATEVHQTAMLFDSVRMEVIPFPEAMPGSRRTQHGAVFVPDQRLIYLIGGFTTLERSEATGTIDVFDVNTLSFNLNASGLRLGSARGGLDAALLNDNRIFIAGGIGREPAGSSMKPLRSLELIFDFIDVENRLREVRVASSVGSTGAPTLPMLPAERLGHRVVGLPAGLGLIIGGASVNAQTGSLQPRLELLSFNPQ